MTCSPISIGTVLSATVSTFFPHPEKPYWHLERKTEDKVFLLSYTEMVEYLIINSGLEFYDHQYAYDELLCYPTEYAKQQLYQVFDIDTCGWWLCNPEYSECVENDDFKTYSEMITAYGQLDLAKMDSIQNAVRPAMWVTLLSGYHSSSIVSISLCQVTHMAGRTAFCMLSIFARSS